jgi:hypothetical protein
MELATIEMERPKARQAFLDYRRAVRERHNAEDEAIMRGYRALAAGKQLIRLDETLVAGGTTEILAPVRRGEKQNVTVPCLAVARATATNVWTWGVDENGACEMRSKRELADSNRRDRIRLRAGTFPTGTRDPEAWWRPRLRAIVPNVPPALRPAHSLDGYHVLFEAEWAVDPLPPVDPALLKHLAGDLWVVVATWDLTPLERAVLAGTRSG